MTDAIRGSLPELSFRQHAAKRQMAFRRTHQHAACGTRGMGGRQGHRGLFTRRHVLLQHGLGDLHDAHGDQKRGQQANHLHDHARPILVTRPLAGSAAQRAEIPKGRQQRTPLGLLRESSARRSCDLLGLQHAALATHT